MLRKRKLCEDFPQHHDPPTGLDGPLRVHRVALDDTPIVTHPKTSISACASVVLVGHHVQVVLRFPQNVSDTRPSDCVDDIVVVVTMLHFVDWLALQEQQDRLKNHLAVVWADCGVGGVSGDVWTQPDVTRDLMMLSASDKHWQGLY
jgi:hypothetical protein